MLAELWNWRRHQQVWFLVLMVRGLSSPTLTHQPLCSNSYALALVSRVSSSVVVKVYTITLCSTIYLFLFFYFNKLGIYDIDSFSFSFLLCKINCGNSTWWNPELIFMVLEWFSSSRSNGLLVQICSDLVGCCFNFCP